jgi:hypothetical protein
LFKDVLKYGQIVRISILTGKQRENQDGLLPLGVEPELGSQVFSILPENMKRGNLTTGL